MVDYIIYDALVKTEFLFQCHFVPKFRKNHVSRRISDRSTVRLMCQKIEILDMTPNLDIYTPQRDFKISTIRRDDTLQAYSKRGGASYSEIIFSTDSFFLKSKY